MKNWLDCIDFHLATRAAQPALVIEEQVVTYAMLRVAVDRCARRIAALGIAGGNPVAIIVANPIRHVALMLALFRAGFPSISLEHQQSGITSLTFTAILGDETARSLVNPAIKFIPVADDWFETDPGGTGPRGFPDGSSICRMSATSGTTAAPKLISISIDEVGVRLGGFTGLQWNVALCLPGISSNWTFISLIATLVSGQTFAFAASPFQAVRMIEVFAVDYLIAATEQLVALTRVARKSQAQLRSLRLVEVGGGVVTKALLDGAAAHVCKEVYCRYAATESGPVSRAPGREILSRPGYVGRLLPGVDVSIVDRGSIPCPPGSMGLVRTRFSPRWNVTAGEAPWIDVDDLGWLTADGDLFIAGRAADAGLLDLQDGVARAISPVHEAEHLLRLEWDAADAAAVVLTGGARPCIGVGTVDCKDADATKLATLLRDRGADCEIRLMTLASIPRNANGKVNRAELKKLMGS
jgi:long-chain acyl-CoA synthetase